MPSYRPTPFAKSSNEKLIMERKKDFRKLPALISGIKIEPGTLGAAPGRLPSFGGRRDLTLGSCGPSKINHSTESKSKRIYAPNLNVQRNKNKIDVAIKEEPNSKEKRDRRKDDGKGRRRDKPNNLVQSSGVFAEGIAGAVKKRYGGRGGGERDMANNFITKPKLNLQRDLKVDKEEEEMKLKALLRDDFIDDPGMEHDADYAPVKLPMLTSAKIKTEIKEEVKPKLVETEEKAGEIKIKQDLLDGDEKNVKPKIENCEIKCGKEPEITKMKNPELITIQDLLQSKEPELIFLQMPDCLPGLKPEAAPGPVKPTSVLSHMLPNDTTETVSNTRHCTLSTLSEGCIGKLQFLKSGRVRLVLGSTVLHVAMGTQVGFREDLISVDLDQSTHSGDMINLGPVTTHLVCSPDWETMLTKGIA